MVDPDWLSRITGEQGEKRPVRTVDLPTDAGGLAPAYPQEFMDEYEKYHRYITAKGAKPGSAEEMWPIFKQNGSLERRYFNPGAALNFAEALRMAGGNSIADSIEEREKRNPRWREDKEEFDKIAELGLELVKHSLLERVIKGH